MDTNVNKIGFAGTYYTLWNVCSEKVHYTDMNGNSYLAGVKTNFNYIKNISKDLEKAKSLYPDLELDEDLFGRNRSWNEFTREKRVNENPHIMTFGKYIDRDINELIEEDFKYVIWLTSSNFEYTDNALFAKSLPVIIEYYKQIDDAVAERQRLDLELYNKILSDGEFTMTLESNLKTGDGFAYVTHKENGGEIHLHFEGENYKEMYYNDYTYGLPTLKGKAKRTKGKSVTLTVVGEVKDEWSLLRLSVKLKSVN